MKYSGLYRGISILFVLLLMITVGGCSGKTPVQTYKVALEKAKIKDQINLIEGIKEQLAAEADPAGFIETKKQIIGELETQNNALIKSLNKIKVKDASVKALHNNLISYTNNNATLVQKSNELLQHYANLQTLTDKTAIEAAYSKIVQAAREIDTLSQQTNAYRIAWDEGLITLDVKTVQK